ncbi:MAG: hypothetical protein IJ865_07230 [Clostridia bacterium]|nr:hypothetical protein [Clostridia bacterium]
MIIIRRLTSLLHCTLSGWFYSARTVISILFILYNAFLSAETACLRLQNLSGTGHIADMLCHFLTIASPASSMLSFVAMLCVLSSIPHDAMWQYTALIRSSRSIWITVHCLTCAIAVVLALAIFLTTSLLFSLPYISPGNTWSDDERLLVDPDLSDMMPLVYEYLRVLPPLRTLGYALFVSFAYYYVIALFLLLFGLFHKQGIGLIILLSIHYLRISILWECFAPFKLWFPEDYSTLTGIVTNSTSSMKTAANTAVLVYIGIITIMILLLCLITRHIDLRFSNDQRKEGR